MALVIIGGGVIGLSIAYYASLTCPDRRIILIDAEDELLLSASGFSGGYIVRDWFAPSVLPLAELSYQLHKRLAEEHDGRHKWGYSESTAHSLVMDADEAEGNVLRGEDWLLHGTSRADVAKKYISVEQASQRSRGYTSTKPDSLLRDDGSPLWANIPAHGTLEKISSPSGCAQVEPRELCEWLIQQCRAHGVEIRLSTRPIGLLRDRQGAITGLRVERTHSIHTQDGRHHHTSIACKDIVIAAGCWTPRVFETLTRRRMTPTIRPLPGYSIVVRSPRFPRSIVEHHPSAREMTHAVFCPPTSSWSYSPECMARLTRDGRPEIYVAGLNDEGIRLPPTAGGSKALMQRARLEDLRRTAVALVGNPAGDACDDDLELVREGLCFRPVSESGLPIIGGVGGFETADGGALYVASGHGPWGITLALGTGLVVAELLQGVEPSANIDAFGLVEQSEALRAHL